MAGWRTALVGMCLVLVSCGGQGRDGVISPVDAGEGFVISVVEKYSLEPVETAEVSFVRAGEVSEKTKIGNGVAPARHPSGIVTQTETCVDPDDPFALEFYTYIASVDRSGASTQVTPCSSELLDERLAQRLDFGQISPDGTRVVAHLFTAGYPTTVIVFEGGQVIERFEGFHASSWVDDDTIVLVGSGLVTLDLGGQPSLVTSELTGALDWPSASPDGRRVAVVNDRAIWVVDIDGSNLREILPAEGYVFPTWSPDGRFVAALQHEPLGPYDGLLAGRPGLVGALYWSDTNYQSIAIVDVDTGQLSWGDLSMHMTESQMPQGRLTWF